MPEDQKDPNTTPEVGKTQRFFIGTVGFVIVVCGWGAVLWSLRHH